MKATRRGSPLSTEERNGLVRLIDADGLPALREASGLSRTALLNAAIGLPVLPGTRALIRPLLDEDEEEDAADTELEDGDADEDEEDAHDDDDEGESEDDEDDESEDE